MNCTAYVMAKVNFIIFLCWFMPVGGHRQQFVAFQFNGHNKQSLSIAILIGLCTMYAVIIKCIITAVGRTL